MQLEKSQFILFDFQQNAEEIAKSLYAVGRGSPQLIRFAAESRRNSRVIICTWRKFSSFYSICSRV